MTVGLFVAYEVCYRIGRARREEIREAKKSQTEVAVAALLALLGLLLAFSFGIGSDRFDKRKSLVLEEANAIATAYLRAELVPAPYDQRIQGLLRQYVQTRVGWHTPEELEAAIRRSSAIHGELWSNAVAVAHETPSSPITALFIDSLNRMIDLQEARVTVGLYQRIPPAVLATLYIVALLSLGMVGVRAGLDRSRGLAPATILIASVMCVMTLIASLDDPRSRLFHVSNHAMRDADHMMTRSPVAGADR